jgi:EAL domain-containing protein (putative c-di-GMP-specific phosphodiesterase class I)
MLAVTVCSQPVVVDRRAVLVDISVDRIANAGEGEHASAVQPGYAQPPTRFLQQVFMQNMTAALALHRAIGQKSFELWTRPILATDNTATLYQECLIGLRKRKDGEPVEAGRVAPALPQNISTRHIDRFIVRKTIELLRRHPSVQLGCHICALSAVNDTWWSSTFKLLAMAPTLAIRLVIEITDTAAGADIAATQQFCERLQSMGCRIAVNGFSDGDGSVAFALAIKPDIVKVSMPVIHAAQAAPPSRLARQLGHFLSGSKACVVAEGVQAERDRETLRRAGIPWAMGCCIGPFSANGNAHFPLAAGFHALLGRLAPIE